MSLVVGHISQCDTGSLYLGVRQPVKIDVHIILPLVCYDWLKFLYGPSL